MADFFYRQAKIKLPTGGNRIRNNAYVTIFGRDASAAYSNEDVKEQLLPSPATSMTATYDPNGTGRPAPILKDVVVKLEGDAGSLRRVEANFTCFDRESFDKLEAALLVPGSKILVKYGYVGPESPSEAAMHEFRVYDYSFKITTENYFECSFKGVGKGGTYEQNNINTAAAFPAKKFVTNYDFINDTTTIQNIFDYMDYRIQRDGNKGTVRSMGNSAFAPKDGISGTFKDKSGNFAILEAPEKYNSPVKLEGGILTDYFLQYVQFKCIVAWLNKYVLYDNIKGDSELPKYKLKFDPKYSGIICDMPSGKVWSADPGKMLFPYEKNAPENNYTEMDKRPEDLDDFEFISCDKIDRSGYQHLQSDSGLQEGMGNPEYILLSRDLMRTIQMEFNSAATGEKNKEEEADKSKGGIILNKFMKSIFANIRDNSGGAWDFYLDQDDLDPEVVWIINRKCPGAPEEIEPLVIDPVGGSNGVRSLDIAASVPQETQAMIFGGSPDTVTEQEIGKNVIQQKEVRTPVQASEERAIKKQQANARKGLTDGMYGVSAISSAKAALAVLVGEMTALERAKKGQFNDGNDPAQLPFPLTFSVVLDGIEGFRFGDTITTNYLPARYREETSGLKIVFTVTKYEHKIANNDWTTTVTALGRIRES